MSKQLKFMIDNKLHDALLREFVSKDLWKPALQACDDAINVRKDDIVKLAELKNSLIDEVGGE